MYYSYSEISSIEFLKFRAISIFYRKKYEFKFEKML